MAESTNDQYSDTSSDLNWPLDHTIERQTYDQVVFENVADQYVKGDDVTAFFTVVHDTKDNSEGDEIGLFRVGCTSIKDCLAYASVQFNPSTTSGSTRHGVATFPSSTLPVTDDEFYQFSYIIKKKKSLGSSIPFQLNCSVDDIDLLSNSPVGKAKSDGLITVADNDSDDIVIIHTKRMLTEEKLRQENRQLLEMNRRLESQKDNCQAKLDSLELKSKEHISKAYNDMQALTTSHTVAIDELSARKQSELKLRAEYDACRSLCQQYQTECAENVERCRALESAHNQIKTETTQIRSQLSVTSQLTKDQATQIIDLERRLMQANELSKTSNQRQTLLEQQIRDLRLTSEKLQVSMEGQIGGYTRQSAEQESQMNALKTTNQLLKEELKSLNADNECLTQMAKQDKELSQELQEQLDQLRQKYDTENESKQNEIELLQFELKDMSSNQQDYMSLKTSVTQLEKLCVKHQKSELEVKRQLTVYKTFVNDLQSEIHDLTERLAAGADAYKTLFRKCTMLESKMGVNHQEEEEEEKPNTTPTTLSDETGLNEEALVTLLRNSYELQQQDHQQQNKEEQKDEEITLPTSTRTSMMDVSSEIRDCPMCYWEFPEHMTLDGKREHIEHHFQ